MLAAVWRELFRFEPILMVRYRWPHSQASEKHPIRGVWADARIILTLFLQQLCWYNSSCNSFETKHKIEKFQLISIIST
jgi:hypothetical protein